MSIPDFVQTDLQALGMEVPAELLERLARYLTMLLEANRQFNLTAIREPDAAWRRHIIDSLTILPGLEELAEGGTVIDVGSGGGLPGIPIAICRPDLQVTLLEATGKKVRFLRSCIDELPLPNTRVLQGRAETLGQDSTHRQRYDVAVCRAVGPMAELLEYTLPLVKVGGWLLAMKGPSVEEELAVASDALDVLGGGALHVFDAYPPEFEYRTVVVRVSKERPTPRSYPRLPGMPRQAPIGVGKRV